MQERERGSGVEWGGRAVCEANHFLCLCKWCQCIMLQTVVQAAVVRRRGKIAEDLQPPGNCLPNSLGFAKVICTPPPSRPFKAIATLPMAASEESMLPKEPSQMTHGEDLTQQSTIHKEFSGKEQTDVWLGRIPTPPPQDL